MERRLDEYVAMLKYAHRLGCKKFAYHGMEVEFEPKLPLSQALEGVKVGEDLNPTEDQLLYWSSGYEPPIQSEPIEE